MDWVENTTQKECQTRGGGRVAIRKAKRIRGQKYKEERRRIQKRKKEGELERKGRW